MGNNVGCEGLTLEGGIEWERMEWDGGHDMHEVRVVLFMFSCTRYHAVRNNVYYSLFHEC